MCGTLGRQVRVELPDGSTLAGEATDVEEAGRLVVRTDDGEHLLSAGDVVHVR
jgi:BirA family biotin operon repressor/biotin-[acetyl-CoA-carboxylase] ligase